MYLFCVRSFPSHALNHQSTTHLLCVVYFIVLLTPATTGDDVPFLLLNPRLGELGFSKDISLYVRVLSWFLLTLVIEVFLVPCKVIIFHEVCGTLKVTILFSTLSLKHGISWEGVIVDHRQSMWSVLFLSYRKWVSSLLSLA